MEKARTKDGVHVVETGEANKYSQDELRLMRTQDLGYLTLKAQTEAKVSDEMAGVDGRWSAIGVLLHCSKYAVWGLLNTYTLLRRPLYQRVERMRSSLHMIGAVRPQHTVFVDGEEEAAAFDPAAYFDTHPDLVGRAFNRPRTEQLSNPAPVAEGDTLAGVAARSERRRAVAYRELLQRQARGQKLGELAARMAYAKEVAGKGRKRKLAPGEVGGQKGVFKWKAERKR